MNKALLFTSLILVLVVIFIRYTIIYIRFVRAKKHLIELEKALLIELEKALSIRRGAGDISSMYPDLTSSGRASGKTSEYLDYYAAWHLQHQNVHNLRLVFNQMSGFVVIAATVILLIANIIA